MNLKGSIKDKQMWLIPQIWQIWVTKSYSAFHVSNKLGRKQHNFAFWKTLAFPDTLSWGSSVLCFLIFKFFMQNLFDTWLQSGWQSAIPQKRKSHIFGVFCQFWCSWCFLEMVSNLETNGLCIKLITLLCKKLYNY